METLIIVLCVAVMALLLFCAIRCTCSLYRRIRALKEMGAFEGRANIRHTNGRK